MRRSIIFGAIISILATGCAIIPAQATTVILPPKADLEAAVTRIESFADYPKYYGLGATPIAPTDPYYQEYEYLHSLATKTDILIANYDDADFTIRNAEAYGIALTAIDQAIASCRYIFGIVRAESLAAQATQAPSSPSSSVTPATTAQAPAQTAQTPVVSNTPTTVATTPVTNTEASSDYQSSDGSNALTTFKSTEAQNPNTDESTDKTADSSVEIPKTGGISQSSSIVFIVLVSFIAATAAAGIYFVYNRRPKHTASAAHRKPRR